MFLQRLEELCRSRSITLTALTKELGIAVSNVTKWKTGRIPKQEILQMIADYFFVSTDYLLGKDIPANAIPVEQSEFIPILGEIRCGAPMLAIQNYIGFVAFDTKGEDYFALRAVGDSMDAAGISEGDIVICKQQNTADNGQICAVCVGEESATLKRVSFSAGGMILSPHSHNPAHQPIFCPGDEARIMGVVVEGRRLYK